MQKGASQGWAAWAMVGALLLAAPAMAGGAAAPGPAGPGGSVAWTIALDGGAGSGPDQQTLSCGGISPITRACGGDLRPSCCALTMGLEWGPGFTGTVENRVCASDAAGGCRAFQAVLRCSVVAGLPPPPDAVPGVWECTQARHGLPPAGAGLAVRGATWLVADPDAPAAGQWGIGVQTS